MIELSGLMSLHTDTKTAGNTAHNRATVQVSYTTLDCVDAAPGNTVLVVDSGDKCVPLKLNLMW